MMTGGGEHPDPIRRIWIEAKRHHPGGTNHEHDAAIVWETHLPRCVFDGTASQQPVCAQCRWISPSGREPRKTVPLTGRM
eukprot:scaffold627_cov247-Pavlova_lutheri.AAC.1